ncbi:MAG: DNA mismatch repair endonuclease MutL [Desulfofustis sp.]|nr:DNA mismatch repair endonuclease MutL [Desulfofustis sp.]
MAKIRILPEHLANQIAAGEVVERPASVVKELLENSLDAGADRIHIEVEGNGTRLIRITDNGEGMDEDDVLMSFERHGTSKLTRDDTVFAVTSLGFRGEAIPSIASVSNMTVISRRPDDELGTLASSHYGTIQKVHEIGSPIGTSIEVRRLFGNTPARKKFLRTARTELAHIDDTVKSYALANPGVGFTLQIDGRPIIQLDRDMDLKQRLARLLKVSGTFIEVDSGSPGSDGIRITGLLVPPESTVPVAGKLRLLVNGRVVKDRLIGHAVSEGMRSFLLKGHYPAGVIRVDLPPHGVDVNVHPAKHEVRFIDSRAVHHRVSTAVREAMLYSQQPLKQQLFSRDRTGLPGHPPAAARIDEAPEIAAPSAAPGRQRSEPAAPSANFPPSPQPRLHVSPTEKPLPLPSLAEGEAEYRRAQADPAVQVEDLVVIGSFQDLYIFCRNGDRLVVIDQHAAHERLLFEELRRQYLNGKVVSQNLLFPVTVELTAYQSQLVEANLDQLENMGFAVRDFGGTTWVVSAVPAVAGGQAPQELFFDMLRQFGSETTTAGGDRIEHVLATMACKAAVKSGDALSGPEIKALLERMARADLFSHCPHGRPVVRVFDPPEIKKWFHRT